MFSDGDAAQLVVNIAPSRRRCATSMGMCAPIRAGARSPKTHVLRLKFPAPTTVETWVSDAAAGDPLLV